MPKCPEDLQKTTMEIKVPGRKKKKGGGENILEKQALGFSV